MNKVYVLVLEHKTGDEKFTDILHIIDTFIAQYHSSG